MGEVVVHTFGGIDQLEAMVLSEEEIEGEVTEFLSGHADGTCDSEPLAQAGDSVLDGVDFLLIECVASPTSESILGSGHPFEVVDMVVERVAVEVVCFIVGTWTGFVPS